MVVHDLRQFLLILHLFSVDGYDQVSAHHNRNVAQERALTPTSQARVVGGSSGNDLDNQQSVIRSKPHLTRQLRIDRNRAHAERRTAYPAEGEQIVDYRFGGVDWDGKANPRALADV